MIDILNKINSFALTHEAFFQGRNFNVNFGACREIPKDDIKNGDCAVYAIIRNNLPLGAKGAFVYIGSSINLRERLLYNHIRDLENDRHDNKHLQNAWNMGSGEDFSFWILEDSSEELCRDREQNWLDFFGFNFDYKILFNICCIVERGPTNRGDSHPNFGKKFSQERRNKMSQIMIEKFRNPENNPMWGKKHTEETKRKISEKATGRKSKFPAWNRGVAPSSEHKNNIGAGVRRYIELHGTTNANPNCKTYILTNPAGKALEIKNLRKFCRENDLSYKGMLRMISGGRPHYKQWRLLL